MSGKKKQITIIIILILAIAAAGYFVLHEAVPDQNSTETSSDTDNDVSVSKGERPELFILLPKTTYKDMDEFTEKYNPEDNKYTLTYQIVSDEYSDDPDVITSDEVDPADYDGLIIPGGKHVHPSFYGAEVECDKHGFDKPLDELEIKLVKKFVDAKKPILGLCRGSQLVNVALGGTLKQDVGMGHYNDAVRATTVRPDSVFYSKFGDNVETVHYHHQAVDELADDLTVTMVDTEDGTIEGYVHDSLPIVCYQFHPDRMYVKKNPQIVEDGLYFMDYFFDMCYKEKQKSSKN